eukprot:2376052-Rhodomonas_salina.1
MGAALTFLAVQGRSGWVSALAARALRASARKPEPLNPELQPPPETLDSTPLSVCAEIVGAAARWRGCLQTARSSSSSSSSTPAHVQHLPGPPLPRTTSSRSPARLP